MARPKLAEQPSTFSPANAVGGPGAAKSTLGISRYWRGSERKYFLISVASLITVAALWEILPETGVINAVDMPAPSSLFGTVGTMWTGRDLNGAIAFTLARFAIGTSIGVFAGLLVGAILGIVHWLRLIIEPLVSIFYPLPRVALIPIILIWIGAGEKGAVTTIIIGPFFVMLIATIAAVTNVDRIYLEVAKSFGAKRRDVYRRVIGPAALPVILSALRLAIGTGLFGTIAIEFLAETTGLGYLVWNSYETIQTNQAYVAIIFAALIGILSYLGAVALERRLVRWR